jgi:uncharacterized protein (TIGR03790 family)
MQIVKLLIVFLFFIAGNVVAKVMPQQVAIVVNTNDVESRLIAEYYQKKRNIPQQNIIEVSISGAKNSISEKEFASIYRQVKKKTPDAVQYYALAWSKPYRVGCMSVTSAFAFGFDKSFCAKGCRRTQQSAY